MPQYEIKYTRADMPEGYVGTAFKHARDEKEAMKYVGSRVDKQGFFKLKRGGIAKLKSITEQ